MVKAQFPNVLRYEIWLVNLDPTVGSEVRKTRPCVVISPDEMNKWIRTVIVAPMTSAKKSYVSRVAMNFQGKSGEVMLDQIKTVDKIRLVKRLGMADEDAADDIANRLVEFFKK